MWVEEVQEHSKCAVQKSCVTEAKSNHVNSFVESALCYGVGLLDFKKIR